MFLFVANLFFGGKPIKSGEVATFLNKNYCYCVIIISHNLIGFRKEILYFLSLNKKILLASVKSTLCEFLIKRIQSVFSNMFIC